MDYLPQKNEYILPERFSGIGLNRQGDISALYGFPLMHRAAPGSTASEMLESAKVLNFARSMPVEHNRIMDPETYIHALRLSIVQEISCLSSKQEPCLFNGKKSSELNRFIKSFPIDEKVNVTMTTQELDIDEPLELRSNLYLNGAGAQFIAKGIDIALIGKEITNVCVKDLVITGANSCGFMLLGASDCHLDNLTIVSNNGYGLVLRRKCHHILIKHSRFLNNLRAGFMIHDGSHHNYAKNCEITGGHHSSNWSGGIVITALGCASEYGILDAFEPEQFYPKDLLFKADITPHQNLIEACYIHKNQSSGIYLDGGNGNVLTSNTIKYNDKEGICLDFYAAANLAIDNAISCNGFRRNQSDNDLRIDCVLEYGRMADGSAVAKLPNISLDNAGLNVILRNTISNAAGDGIKIVRSGFRNIIGLNSIIDNNQGQNYEFNFYGILLGSAGCEVENDTSGLDRLPSLENIIFGNMIYGHHAAGIVYDIGSVYNDTFDNMVMKQHGPFYIQHTEPNNMIGNNFSSYKVIDHWWYPSKWKVLLPNILFTKLFRIKRYIKQIFKRFL